jgi:hypothetical protein
MERIMETELNTLLDKIRADYYAMTLLGRNESDLTEFNRKMISEFNNSLSYTDGKKYIKIIRENSVWGFIVKDSDDKFKRGDILKAASFAAPAKNKARGNIIDQDFSWVRWTGPEYL